LFTARPLIAGEGSTLYLEGSFGAALSLDVTGGSRSAATLLGTSRATWQVPAASVSGPLAAACGGPAPLPFQRVNYTLGMNLFSKHFEQTSGAASQPRIGLYPDLHDTVVIGDWVYVVGGSDPQTGVSAEIARATIDADGALGDLQVLDGSALTFARVQHSVVVIGNYVYAIGGNTGMGLLDSVDRAPINSDGSLGAFAITASTLVKPRASFTTEIIGSYLYVIGGVSENGTPTGAPVDSIERAPIAADGSLGAFELLSGTLTSTRAFHSSAVVGTNLYVIGGGDGEVPLATLEAAAISPDGTIGRFAVVPGVQLGTPRTAHQTLVFGDRLYVIGGLGGFNYMNSTLATIERASIQADGSLGAFTVAPTTLNDPRESFGLVQVGSYVYAIGGYQVEQSVTLGMERVSIDTSAALDVFAPSGALTTTRSGHAVVSTGNRLYVVGGTSGGAPTGTIELAAVHPDGAIDAPAIDTTTSLVTPRAYFATAKQGGHVFVLGGSDASGHAIASLERATIAGDGSLGKFSPYALATLMTARERAAAIVIDNYLYVIGGRDSSGAAIASTERGTFFSGTSLQSFADAGAALTTARYGHALAVIGGTVYVFGGTDASGDVLSSVEKATIFPDGSISSFTTVAGVTLQTARTGAGAAVVGSRVYLFGGSSASGALDSVEQAVIGTDQMLGNFSTVARLQLPEVRGEPAVASSGNYVLLVGGSDSGGQATSSIARSLMR